MFNTPRPSRLHDPEFEKLRPYSDWRELVGIDVRQYFRVFDCFPTGNLHQFRMTDFYCIRGNYIFGLPENPQVAQALWERLWKQRKQKALRYFEARPTDYARTFEQMSQFVADENLKVYAALLREKAGLDLAPPDATWHGSQDFGLWYTPEEKAGHAYVEPTGSTTNFQDYRHLVERFLEDVHGQKDPTSIWRGIDKTHGRFQKNWEHVKFSEVVLEIEKASNERREAYFNICPSKFIPAFPFENPEDAWISDKPRTFWIDFDRKLTGIAEKQEMLEVINSRCEELGIPYTHRVETRNGFHIYWVMSTPFAETTWKRVQRQLIAVLKDQGADPNITSLGICPRLPYTNHWKSENTPFLLELTFQDIPKYDLGEFMARIHVPTEEEEAILFLTGIKTSRNHPKTQNEPERFNLAETSMEDWGSQAVEAIKVATKDFSLLCSYLRIPQTKWKRFSCTFSHPDKNPSARIYEESQGNWVYHCFSCGKHGDILTLMEDKSSRREALLELFKLMGRKDLADFKAEIDLEYLDVNLRQLKDFKSKYSTELNNDPVRKWVLPRVELIFEVAKKKIIRYDGKFPASHRELAGDKKNHTHDTNKLYLLKAVGLIHTVPMPNSSVLRESQAKFQGSKGYRNPTGWHLVPKWTPEMLEKAFEELERWFKVHLTTNDVTRENVRRVYGKEAEDRVYHGKSTVLRIRTTRIPSMGGPRNYPTLEEIEEREEHLAQMLALSEEEFEEYLFDAGGEKFLQKYREAS